MIDEPDVYLMAFACEPDRGSEPGVGFAFARAGARLARERGRRVVLVTRPHRVRQIRDALGEDAPHLEILTVPLPRLVVAATGRTRPRPAYVLWQLLAALRLRRVVREAGRPAVVHHVTFATEALPAFEALIGAPVVFGPAGSAALAGGGAAFRTRRALRAVVARSNTAGAAVLVAQNDAVRGSWESAAAWPTVEPNIVIEPRTGPRPPLRWDAACAGYLVERKRVDLAIEAFAASGATGRLVVIGDGPALPSLRLAAVRAGVADRVDFTGALPRDAVLDHLSRSALLLHPSRQEGAPWVVGEAQAMGCRPVVFAGSGADGPVLAAGLGEIVLPGRPEGLREAIDRGLAEGRAEPSTRWSAARLPELMEGWYARAALRQPQGVA